MKTATITLLSKIALGFLLFFLCVPTQASWTRNMYKRLGASVSSFSQRVRNFSAAVPRRFFSATAEKTTAEKSTQELPKSSTWFSGKVKPKWFAWFGVPAAAYGSWSQFASKNEDSKDSAQQKNQQPSTINRETVLILACNVLHDQHISVRSPLAQIKALTHEQQYRAFNYLMQVFEMRDYELYVPEFYEVMKLLGEPKKEYPRFFNMIAENTGNCRRDAMVDALGKEYALSVVRMSKLPPQINEMLKLVPPQDWYGLRNGTTPMPERIEFVRENRLQCIRAAPVVEPNATAPKLVA